MTTNIDYISFFFDNPHIFDLIFSSLSQYAIIQCSLTSKQMYAATTSYNSRAFDINKHLAAHFKNVTNFRCLQRQTGLIISGSNAIQFFDRTEFNDSDLDLYVTDNFAERVEHWLMEYEYYEYMPLEDDTDSFDDVLKVAIMEGPSDELADDPYNNSGILGVFNFKKKDCPFIQLVCTNISPVHAVLSFHSTCVMNFITFEGAYSLYPKATFRNRTAVAMGRPKPNEYAKYTSRGWIIHNDKYISEDDRGLFLPDETRFVLDSNSWIINFDTTDIAPREAPTSASRAMTKDPAVTNSWVLPATVSETTELREMHFSLLSASTLQNKYLVGDDILWYCLPVICRKLHREEEIKRVQRNGSKGDGLWQFRDYEYQEYIHEYFSIEGTMY